MLLPPPCLETSTQAQSARPTCYRCLRPATHCLCEFAPPFAAHCNILVLQHPQELKKYYSTAKLLVNAITNARLVRGVQFDSDYLSQLIPSQRSYLLFPGSEAQDCHEVELDANATVVVIDGTWSQAGRILRTNPALMALPRISFRTVLQSNYRIRKQPKLGCLSTIESVAHLLIGNAQASGKNPGPYAALFELFNAMVEKQLVLMPL